MPKPRKGEKKSDFVSRCMSDPEAKRIKPKPDERLGFCFGLWEQAVENEDFEDNTNEDEKIT